MSQSTHRTQGVPGASKAIQGLHVAPSQSRWVQRMRRGIKLVIPKIPLTLHSPSRGKAVPPFRGYHFCLAGARAQTPQGALELVVPVRKLCGVGSACAFVSQGDLINQHTPQPTKLLSSFRYCLLMETTSAKTAAKNRMNAGSPS